MNIKFLAFFLMFLLAGCSSVTCNYPVGLENFVITVDDWNGTWFCEDTVITILVTDETKGIVQLAWIEKKEGTLKFESITCQIMKGRKWLYASVLEGADKKDGQCYFWAKITKDNKKIVIWRPAVAAFRDAVTAKILQAATADPNPIKEGTFSDDSVHIIDRPEIIVDLVESKGSTYFEWEEPTILVKLSD